MVNDKEVKTAVSPFAAREDEKRFMMVKKALHQ